MSASKSYCTLLLPGLLALSVALSPSAQAFSSYFEFGGTMASWTNPGAALRADGKQTSTSASSSFGVPMTLGLQLQDRQSGLLFSIGAQNRFIAGQSGAGESFIIMPTSGVFRVEFWRLVLGVGYAPFVWQNLTFSRAIGDAKALTLEGQFLFPITPEIDFGLQAAQTSFTTAFDSSGKSKVMEYGAFFRLNFGLSSQAVTERHKYKGWRYPFGSPLN